LNKTSPEQTQRITPKLEQKQNHDQGTKPTTPNK